MGNLFIRFGSGNVPISVRNDGSEDTADAIGFFLQKNSETRIEMWTARNVLIGTGTQSIDLTGRGQAIIPLVEDDEIRFYDELEGGSLLRLRDSTLTVIGFSSVGDF